MKRALPIAAAAAAWLLLCPAATQAAVHTVEMTVSAGKFDRSAEPVCVPLQLPKGQDVRGGVLVTASNGKVLGEGQLTRPGLATRGIAAEAGKARYDLWFVLPALKAGESLALKATIHGTDEAVKARGDSFVWVEKTDKGAGYSELRFGERPVLGYVHPTLDESSAAARTSTFKPFHHVYDPATGKRLVTKGVGGEFTHHRGLFYGFMKTSYDKSMVDIWHCRKDTHQAHQKVEQAEAGPVLGRHVVQIHWNGDGKKTFAAEQRELTAYALPGGTLIEFASLLTPTGGPVKLDGDPQHAGFHFRANNEVAGKDGKKQTIFIRPSGDGKPGTEVNWPGNKKHVNLPWLGMSFVLGGQRFTAAYLDRPDNPKEARFSERTYGRMGSYFVTTVTKEKPLLVRYRVWVQEGQMTGDQIRAKAQAFVTPAEVKVK